MRFLPKITEILNSGLFIGNQRHQTRVTVEPYWHLKTTTPGVGTNGSRGPYRYWQLADNSQFEVEVPNIKNVDIDRSLDQEIASCSISMYNHWHQGNTVPAQLAGQLGEPGRFWFGRGSNALANDLWDQDVAVGATAFDGTDLPTFSWENVLVPHAMLRTYQGYGGFEPDGSAMSIQDAVAAGNLAITGVWLIDSLHGGTDGMLTFSCRDVGRILRDQQVYPPVVPATLYPIEYVPPGQSNFDSLWGPQPRHGGARSGEHGKLRLNLLSSSTMESGYEGERSVDGKYNTYSLSTAGADADTATHNWHYIVRGNSIVNGFTIYPYGGGYTVYVSIKEDGVWRGAENIPGTSEKYVRSYGIKVEEVGQERPLSFPLPTNTNSEQNFGGFRGTLSNPLEIKFTFAHNRYLPGPGGDGYRAGIRDLILTSMSDPVDLAATDDYTAPIITSALGRHPTRGYFIADREGNTYGFGDGAGYDTESGLYPVGGVGSDNVTQSIPLADVNGIATLKDGRSYWTVDAIGKVHAYGDAVHYGEWTVPNSTHGIFSSTPDNVLVAQPSIFFDPNNPQTTELRAMDIAAAHDDQGYWVLYSNGHVHGFGSAANTPGMTSATWGADDVMGTDVMRFMEAITANHSFPFIQLRGTAIVGHPTRLGFWAMNGCGEVWAVGDNIPYHGGLVNRVYDSGFGVSWVLGNSEYARGIECSWDGDGYWITAGSGLVGQFGNTIGVGVTNFYSEIYGITQPPPTDPFHEITSEELIALAPSLIGDIVRSPSGKGFYVLGWGGWVGAVNSDVWGNPGYWGNSGFLWNEGNYPTPPGRDADYVDIVKELLMWGGFYLYDPVHAATQGTDPEEFPALYGATESTGISSTARITLDKFDKKSLLDCINILKEIVAYNFFIDEDGGVRFESPNWWRSGNYVMNGKPDNTEWDGSEPVGAHIAWETPTLPVPEPVLGYRVYKDLTLIADLGPSIHEYHDPSGTSLNTYNVQAYSQTTEWGDTFGDTTIVDDIPAITVGGHTDYIPTLHEAINIIGYSAVADGASTLTEIVVGSQEPRFNDLNTVQATSYVPPTAVAELYDGHDTTYSRGINRPAWMMNSQILEGDRQLMAELINLQLWFSQRAGQVQAIADPCIQLNDQVQIVERNTSEVYTHYVRSIKTSANCDTGSWTMNLSTNWLGEPGDWVITKDDVTNPFTHVQATESISAWLKDHTYDVALTSGKASTGRAVSISGSSAALSSERLNWALDSSRTIGSVSATPTPWTLYGTIMRAFPVVTGMTITTQAASSFIGTPQIRFFISSAWTSWVNLPSAGGSALVSTMASLPDADVPFQISAQATAHGTGTLRLSLSGDGVTSDIIFATIVVTT